MTAAAVRVLHADKCWFEKKKEKKYFRIELLIDSQMHSKRVGKSFKFSLIFFLFPVQSK